MTFTNYSVWNLLSNLKQYNLDPKPTTIEKSNGLKSSKYLNCQLKSASVANIDVWSLKVKTCFCFPMTEHFSKYLFYWHQSNTIVFLWIRIRVFSGIVSSIKYKELSWQQLVGSQKLVHFLLAKNLCISVKEIIPDRGCTSLWRKMPRKIWIGARICS